MDECFERLQEQREKEPGSDCPLAMAAEDHPELRPRHDEGGGREPTLAIDHDSAGHHERRPSCSTLRSHPD